MTLTGSTVSSNTVSAAYDFQSNGGGGIYPKAIRCQLLANTTITGTHRGVAGGFFSNGSTGLVMQNATSPTIRPADQQLTTQGGGGCISSTLAISISGSTISGNSGRMAMARRA